MRAISYTTEILFQPSINCGKKEKHRDTTENVRKTGIWVKSKTVHGGSLLKKYTKIK